MTDAVRDGQLHGRVAIVTGGGSGIGAAAAMALAADGAHVVLVGRTASGLAATAELLRQSAAPPWLSLALDVAVEDDARLMAAETLNAFGRIDVLVAAAGTLRGAGGWPRRAVELPVEGWREVLGTNLTGVFLTNRAVLPAMARQGGGTIINVSSTSGLRGLAYDTAYCASKFGVIGLSEAIADEMREAGVRVCVLLPGAVDTPMWHGDVVPHLGPALSLATVGDLVRLVTRLPDDVDLPRLVLTPPDPTSQEVGGLAAAR